MEYQQVKCALENNIGLVTYHKNNTICTKFLTLNLYSSPEVFPTKYVSVYNLITNAYELLDWADVLKIIHAPGDEKGNLYNSFITSKKRFSYLKTITEDWNILDSLADQVNMVFANGIPLEVVLFVSETNGVFSDKVWGLKEFVENTPTNTLLEFVLEHLLQTNPVTLSCFKKTYIELLNKKKEIIIESIKTEWSLLAMEYPQIYVDELLTMIVYVHDVVKQTETKFNRIQEHKIVNDWSKLIKLAYNCWPIVLQPNPFRLLTAL